MLPHSSSRPNENNPYKHNYLDIDVRAGRPWNEQAGVTLHSDAKRTAAGVHTRRRHRQLPLKSHRVPSKPVGPHRPIESRFRWAFPARFKSHRTPAFDGTLDGATAVGAPSARWASSRVSSSKLRTPQKTRDCGTFFTSHWPVFDCRSQPVGRASSPWLVTPLTKYSSCSSS